MVNLCTIQYNFLAKNMQELSYGTKSERVNDVKGEQSL